MTFETSKTYANFAIDNISVTSVDTDNDIPSAYTVSYVVDGTTTYEDVASDDASYPVDVPVPAKTGYTFQYWLKDDDTTTQYTSDQVKALTITADTTFTAVFEQDPNYVDTITKVTISGPSSMTFGEDANTASSNAYSLTINGTVIDTLSEDYINNAVDDFNVTWDIDGFKTENDTKGQYCDSYGEFSVNDRASLSTTFDVRGGISGHNYYGMLKATVTYNDETHKAEKAVVALGDTSAAADQILPDAGYPSDFDAYPDSLVGYTTHSDTNGESFDDVVGGWTMSGSDSGTAVITKESENKFIRITAKTVKKSHVFTNTISTPRTQAIFEQDVRFNSTGGCITLTSGFPFWSSNSRYKNPVTLNFDGSTIKLNDTAITNNNQSVTIEQKNWYKVVLSVDKTTKTAFVKLYNTDGSYVGGVDNVAWKDDSSPTYYSIGLGNSNTGTIDFDNYKAYIPTASEENFTITAAEGKTELSIDNTESTALTASAATAEGYEMTSTAS